PPAPASRVPALAALVEQPRLERALVDLERRGADPQPAERVARHPALRAVGPARHADLQPQMALGVAGRAQHEVDLGRAVLGVEAQPADGAVALRRTRADRA